MILERQGVIGTRFEYPAARGSSRSTRRPRHATFEIVDPAGARALQTDLGALERALGADASPSSTAVARAGYLAELGLLHDARLTVLAALARDRDDPVLHTVLGTLYTQSGLPQQATAAFDEAQSLLNRGPK